jgi:hypothetical protein
LTNVGPADEHRARTLRCIRGSAGVAPDDVSRPGPRVEPSSDSRLPVVVLTHGCAERVLATLAKLIALPDRIRIIVVDNASSDATAARIREAFPSVELVVAPSNTGIGWPQSRYRASSTVHVHDRLSQRGFEL